MSSRSALQITRRTTVGLALLAVAGCTSTRQTTSPTASGSTSPQPQEPATDEATDQDLVEQARAELLGLIDLLQRTGTAYSGLGPTLMSFVDLHTAHDEVLAASAPGATAAHTGDVPGGRRRAVIVVRRHEITLRDQLARWAKQARSGSLARLFASMSAATSQHLELLPPAGPRSA